MALNKIIWGIWSIIYSNKINQNLVFCQVKNQWRVTINNDTVAIFESQANISLRQVNKIKRALKLVYDANHPERSRWMCLMSEVNSSVFAGSHNEYAWRQRMRHEVRGQDEIEGHTCLRVDLFNTSYIIIVSSIFDVTPLINFKLFWFSLTWRNCIFACLTKSHRVIIYCHTLLIFQLAKKTLIYQNIVGNWSNTSYS